MRWLACTPLAIAIAAAAGAAPAAADDSCVVASAEWAARAAREGHTASAQVGRLPDATVRETLATRIQEIRQCGDVRWTLDPGWRGTVSLRLLINRAGRVVLASPGAAVDDDPSINTCAARLACSWLFPEAPVMTEATASVPLAPPAGPGGNVYAALTPLVGASVVQTAGTDDLETPGRALGARAAVGYGRETFALFAEGLLQGLPGGRGVAGGGLGALWFRGRGNVFLGGAFDLFQLRGPSLPEGTGYGVRLSAGHEIAWRCLSVGVSVEAFFGMVGTGGVTGDGARTYSVLLALPIAYR